MQYSYFHYHFFFFLVEKRENMLLVPRKFACSRVSTRGSGIFLVASHSFDTVGHGNHQTKHFQDGFRTERDLILCGISGYNSKTNKIFWQIRRNIVGTSETKTISKTDEEKFIVQRPGGVTYFPKIGF